MASFRPSALLNLRVTTNHIERDRTQRREPLALQMYATLQVPLVGGGLVEATFSCTEQVCGHPEAASWREQ